jgi:hypothetical protein
LFSSWLHLIQEATSFSHKLRFSLVPMDGDSLQKEEAEILSELDNHNNDCEEERDLDISAEQNHQLEKRLLRFVEELFQLRPGLGLHQQCPFHRHSR